MFEHIYFARTNKAASRQSTLASINEGNDRTDPTTPDMETMIIGYKPSYAHEAASERNVSTIDNMDATAASEIDMDDKSKNATKHVDGDEGSILSVETDDECSGSTWVELQNSHIDSIDDNGSEFRDELTVQAIQDEAKSTADGDSSQQRSSGQPEEVCPLRDTIESTSSLPTSAARPPNIPKDSRTTTSMQKGMNDVSSGRMARKFFFMFTLIAFLVISKKSFASEEGRELSKNHMHSSINSVTKLQSTPFPSQATEEVEENISQLHVPNVHITHSIEPAIADRLTYDSIDSDGFMYTSMTPTVVNGPMVSLANVPQLWIPLQIIDFVAAIRCLPSCCCFCCCCGCNNTVTLDCKDRVVSMIICMATIAVTGCVFILLLAKFTLLTWKKATVPEENDVNGNIDTDHPKKRLLLGKRNTHPKIMSAKSFHEFTQSAHFSRTGRRSRFPQAKSIKGAYNIGCYEQLTMDDLKLIGNFLGIRRLSKLKQKSNLIDAIVAQYEISLQSLDMSDIKLVLYVRKMSHVATNTKTDLIKLAIEVGF